jgi:hypothetical protein
MAITDINLSGKVRKDVGTGLSGADVSIHQTAAALNGTILGNAIQTDSNGTWSITATTLTANYDVKINKGDSTRYIAWSDEIALKTVDTSVLKVRGATNGAAAPIYLFADMAEAAGDGWRIQATDDDKLAIGSNKASASAIIDYITITNGANAASSLTAIGGSLVIGHTGKETISIDGSTDLSPGFQILGTAAADSSMMLAAFSTTATIAGSPILGFVKGGNATIGSHTVVTNNEELGNIVAYGDDGTDLEAIAAQIQFEVDGTPGTGDMPGRIVFATTADGAEVATEAMRIDSSQDVSLLTDSVVLGFGADKDTTLTHTDGTGLTLNSTNKLTFGDAASFIQQSADGTLRVDGEAIIDLNASTRVDVSAALTVGTDVNIGDDLSLTSDSSVFNMGAGNDFTITHDGTTGATIAGNPIIVDSGAQIELDSATGIITFEDGGTEVLRFTEGNSGDVTVKLVTDGKDLIFTDNGDATGLTIKDAAAGIVVPGEVMTTKVSFTDGDDAITIADGGGITAAAGITSTAAANAFGASAFNEANITNVGDIALDSISADDTDINVAVSDNSATAMTIKQGSNAYVIIDTANSSESVSIGTGISGTAITLGHATSETTVADNLTVTGDLSVSGAAPALKSTIVGFSRTALQGSGDQAITGAGFAPSAAVIFAMVIGGTAASFGFGDDAAGEGHIRKSGSAWAGVSQAVNLNDTAGNVMDAVVKTMDADGLTLTWTKSGSGLEVEGVILFIR